MDERSYTPTENRAMMAGALSAPHPAAVARDRETAERRVQDVITALGFVFGPPTETAVYEAVVTMQHLQADAEGRLESDLMSARAQAERLNQEKAELVGELVTMFRRLDDYVKALEAKTKPSARPKYLVGLHDLALASQGQVQRIIRTSN